MTVGNSAVGSETASSSAAPVDHDRRQLLSLLTAIAGGSAIGLSPANARAQSDGLPTPRRALTGRDESGKSVFKSFDVTP
jgi:hypothetical protein